MGAYEKEQLKNQVKRKVEWERQIDRRIEKDYPSIKLFTDKVKGYYKEPKIFLMDD